MTTYLDIVVGDKPVAYDSENGTVLICGEPVDGHLFLELMNRVSSAMRREGRIHQGGAASFVAQHLDADGVADLAKRVQWDNVLNAYPEEMRDELKQRLPLAREVLEHGTDAL